MPAPSRADQTLQRNAELCVKPANHRERQVARTIENFIHAIRFTNRRLQIFDGQPLLCRAFAATDTPQLSARIVVTRSAQVQALCKAQGVPVLLHALPGRNDTVRLGLSALLAQHPELTGCMFLPGDQPLLRRATVDQLLTAFEQTQKETERVIFRLGAPAGNGPDPLVGSPVLFSNGFFPELLTLPEGKGGSVLLHKYPTLVHTACIAQPEELADTDTPAALAQLEALVREKG